MASEIEQYAKFNQIRYAQCWEDADVLLDALDPQPNTICLSIASAGDNTLALLTRSPQKVIAVDLNPAQLACLELRVAAYQTLTHAELLILMGSVPATGDRLDFYRRCRPILSEPAQQFWDHHLAEISRGIGFAGKFERYLNLFRRRILPLIHSRSTIQQLFTLRSPAARQSFYDHHWDTWRWRSLMRLFLSKLILGRLGRDPSFFRYATDSVTDHLLRRIRHTVITLDPADNPYLQWIVLGRHTTALPLALRPEHFQTIRQNLHRLEWQTIALEDWLAAQPDRSLDRANLSNIFEYLSAENTDSVFRELWRVACPNARLVYWNMIIPRSSPADGDRIQSHSELASQLHQRDRVWFYRTLHIETLSDRSVCPSPALSLPYHYTEAIAPHQEHPIG
jgi:S-adenosylmethionine-diacylglycerol 3-amino-3-carboxypropyl transferase